MLATSRDTIRSKNTFIIHHIIIILILNHEIVSQNCSHHIELSSLPQAFVYNASAYDQNVGTTINYDDTNGTITFKTDGSEKVYLGLECRHNLPIKWIFDGDFRSHGLKEIHHTTKRTVNVEQFDYPETYKFLVRIEFEFLEYENPPIFICQVVDNPCEKRVVFPKYDTASQEINFKLISNDVAQSMSEIVALQETLNARPLNDTQGCIANLTYSYDEVNLFFSLDPKENNVDIASIYDPQSFENYYRIVAHQKKECATYFDSVEDLPCMQEGLPEQDRCKYAEINGQSVGIVYILGGERRVFKGFPDLNYVFHAGWEADVDPLDLIFVSVQSASKGEVDVSKEVEADVSKEVEADVSEEVEADVPEEIKFYVGQEIEITCHASPLHFAHGTLIALNTSGNTFPFFDKSTEESDFLSEEFGTREAKTTLRLEESVFEEFNGSIPESIDVLCFVPVWDSAKWIIKSRAINLSSSEQPSVIVFDFNHENNTFICEGFGTPLPNLEIIFPKENFNITPTTYNTNTSTIIIVPLPLLDESYEGNYTCVASSVIGTGSKSYDLKIQTKGFSLTWIIMIMGAVLGSFVLLSIGLMLKLFTDKAEYQRKTRQAIRDFEKGFRDDVSMCSLVGLEYDREKYEVPLEMWDLDGTLLGSGAFGKVHRGYVKTEEGKKLVAIKIVNAPSNVDDFRTTLMELTVMSYMGTHENVVSLVAACVENIEHASLLLGVEYCMNGSLEDFLKKHRPLFHNFVKEGRLSLDDLPCQGPYANILASANFSTLDLYKWSYQIANGMEFLETKRILHADLATRNVLLTQDKVAKISDFGLSRALTQSLEYTKKTFVQLPWKWMAPESLRSMQFSSKSDVWSYGVTLWEIFSIGSEPWPFETWTVDYMEQLEAGRRLARPQYCTENTYNGVVAECWRFEPDDRITFVSARRFFEQAIIRLGSSSGPNTSEDYFTM